jgi:hypothetical protein
VTPLRKKSRPQIGDLVLVVAVPETVKSLPRSSRRAFQLAVGHQFKVKGRNQVGWLHLEVGRIVDPILGGFMNSIWIEPSCVRVRRRRRVA